MRIIGTAVNGRGLRRVIRRVAVGAPGCGVAARAAGHNQSDLVRPPGTANAQLLEDFAEANPGVEVVAD